MIGFALELVVMAVFAMVSLALLMVRLMIVATVAIFATIAAALESRGAEQ